MRWSEEFETGLADIDSQHRQIFALIQRMHLLENDVDRSEIQRMVDDVGRLARCHFEYEEWLMAAHGYPESERHVAEHTKLMTELEGYRDNAVFRPRQLARVLANWLISHTLLDDRPLVLHIDQLRASGVNVPAPRHLIEAFSETVLDVGAGAAAARLGAPA